MKLKLLKSIVSIFAAAAVCMISTSSMLVSADEAASETAKFLKSMGTGWNLGNSFDSAGDYTRGWQPNETGWGNPTPTKELIKAVHAAGFQTIRIPVSWHDHADVNNNYNIDPSWMKKVKDTVDYAYNEGMYVIINIHHDNMGVNDSFAEEGGFYPSSEKKDESIKYLTSIWKQISNEFKSYGERLIFETLNEPRLAGTNEEWWFDGNNEKGLDAIKTINSFNQEIVNTIRETGGNNAGRYIMVPGYAAGPDFYKYGFEFPTDPVKENNERLLLSTHGYTPYELCLGGDRTEFDAYAKNAIDNFFKMIDDRFVSKGISVVMGECGISDKGNAKARTEWASYYYSKAKSLNIPCVVWDNGGSSDPGENHSYINRNNYSVESKQVVDVIMKLGFNIDPSDNEQVSETTPQETTPQVTQAQETTPQVTTASETTSQAATVSETTPQETTVSETTPQETTVSETTPQETTVSETTSHATTVSETTSQAITVSETTPQAITASETTPQTNSTVAAEDTDSDIVDDNNSGSNNNDANANTGTVVLVIVIALAVIAVGAVIVIKKKFTK